MEFKYWLENKDVTESEEFKKWFQGSILVDDNGKPIPVFHGTQQRPFEKFSKEITTTGRHDPRAARGVISFAFDFEYASTRYGGLRKDPEETKKTLGYFPHGRTIEAYLKLTNPFDYRKSEHREILFGLCAKNTDEWARTKARFLDPSTDRGKELGVTQENREEQIRAYVDEQVEKCKKYVTEGHWSYLEDPPFLRRFGFDGVYTFEFDQLHVHVLDADQIWVVKQTYNQDLVK